MKRFCNCENSILAKGFRNSLAVVLTISVLSVLPRSAQSAEPNLFGEVSRACSELQRSDVQIQPRSSSDRELIRVSSSEGFNVIYVNQALFGKLPSYVGEFELFSACGRTQFLELNEPDRTFESDCWAVQSLIRLGRWSTNDVQRVIDWYFQRQADSISEKGMPLSVERAKKLYSCSR